MESGDIAEIVVAFFALITIVIILYIGMHFIIKFW